MSERMLTIAIVGHTNTGKTSLIRTLLRRRDFGEVDDRGGTTRQIVSASLDADGRRVIELYDSPGLENAPELLEWMERLPGPRHHGPERIAQLLEDASVRETFGQEARVLGLMLEIDIALYVIDAREPVLEKYQDELAVLGLSATPIIAVLNFTASQASREREWRQALARVGLHTVLSFDAAVRDPATEIRLFEKLKSQLDGFEAALEAWLAVCRSEEHRRRQASVRAIASMLVDVAACRRRAPSSDSSVILAEMQAGVREREQACVETLLDLYRFSDQDYVDADWLLKGGRWRADPFDPETLRHYGLGTGKYAGAGAGTGAVVDLGTGGLSLGGGTVAGALIGAGIGLVRSGGGHLLDRTRGYTVAAVDDATLRLLAWRQLCLLAALIRRGHASSQPLRAPAEERWKRGSLPWALRRARHHSEWSSLNSGYRPDSSRQALVESLAEELETDLPEGGASENRSGFSG